MIHVDSEKEIMEFEGSGGELITEIAGVIAATAEDVARASTEEEFSRFIDLVMAAIGLEVKTMVKAILKELGEGEGSDEKGHVEKERDRESIRTNIKQFRRGRKGRSLS